MTDRGLLFRTAGPADARAVAGLHADSWQRHYRGAYTDAFLDGETVGYLGRMWAERLASPSPRSCTILAEHEGELVGLAHTLLDASPTWGALIDNLHVRYAQKRQGIGTLLLARTAMVVQDRLYLWVLEQNTMAQAFYSVRGGECVERGDVPAPGGDATRLSGRPRCLRYVWRDPSVLFGQE